MLVYLTQPIAQAGRDYLTARGYEYVVGEAADEETMVANVERLQPDAIIVRTAKLTKRVIEASKKLKVIGRHGVGTDNIDLETCRHLGVRVTNGPMSNTESVAEHTMALMLSTCRLLKYLDQEIQKGNFAVREKVRLMDLSGKVLGIVGPGRIGKAVARRAYYGFGMKVIAWGTSHPENLPEYIQCVDSVETLFEQADVVSLHCPYTEKTKGLVTAELLSHMRPTAFFINTGRGELADYHALYEALKEGRIAGAGLDVYPGEKPAKDEPLLALQNVICTPHCASHTNESFDNMAVHAAMGVHEVLSGEAVTWPVV